MTTSAFAGSGCAGTAIGQTPFHQYGVVSIRCARRVALRRVLAEQRLVDLDAEAGSFRRPHAAILVDPDLRLDDSAETLVGLDRPRRRLVHHLDPCESRCATGEMDRRSQAEAAQPVV